ncbi:hypothetical protein [Lentzea sp. CA-135723]|uniref:hypothetical protein n=1 Tax=Lentzea sp. CA-135723 TaxID=3239950 RepID=UPI003D8D7E6A
MKIARLDELIEAKRYAAFGEELNALTPVERRALAPELLAFGKRHRASDRPRWQQEGLAIAGAAVLPSAATLAPWLTRYPIWSHHWTPNGTPEDASPVLFDVLRRRDLPWLPDLVARLAVRMPTGRLSRPDLMRLVLEFCGDTPPDSDGFLLHLLAHNGVRDWRPGLDVLLPRLLEVPGAGAYFGDARPVQALLCARTDRGRLLDGCLAGLRQGGQGEVLGFLDLHRAIGVTVEEAAAHVRDYVALLPDSRSTVATAAQDQLKRVDDAGRLDFGLLTEASRWVFARTEKKLVRAQLAWLANHARARPDEVVLTAAALFSHESDDLRGQAVDLVARTPVSDATRAELTAPAARLPADLAARLGVEAVAEETAALVPYAPAPWPGPIATLDELTGEVRSAFGRNTGDIGPVATERIIEAVVRFAWQNRDAVARAFAPLYEQHPWILRSHAALGRASCWTVFAAIIAAPALPLVPAEVPAAHFADEPPVTMLGKRLLEIAQGLVRSPRPALVSTPEWTSGLLDPATLLDRLGKAEAEGWEPWPRDLFQACRRLPRGTRPDDFTAVRGGSGELLRGWLANVREPVAELVERAQEHRATSHSEPVTTSRLLVTLTPGLPAPERVWHHYNTSGSLFSCWPAVLPSQRETVAAHTVPIFAIRRDGGDDAGPALSALAEADGPVGVATHLALAYGLGAAQTVSRACAVDALLILAARDQFDGKAFGDVVGTLLARGDLSLNRLVPCLRDAARSGAAGQIWDVLAAALPKSWSHTRIADLIELAVELAQLVEPTASIDGLTGVAARKGSSKAVVQAKRLVAALG